MKTYEEWGGEVGGRGGGQRWGEGEENDETETSRRTGVRVSTYSLTTVTVQQWRVYATVAQPRCGTNV